MSNPEKKSYRGTIITGAVLGAIYATTFGAVYGAEKLSQSSEADVHKQEKAVNEAQDQLAQSVDSRESDEQSLGAKCVALMESYVDGGFLERQGLDKVSIAVANNPEFPCGNQPDEAQQSLTVYKQAIQAEKASMDLVEDEKSELQSRIESENRSELNVAAESAGIAATVDVAVAGTAFMALLSSGGS